METLTIITLLLIISGWYALPRLFPARPTMITPIKDDGTISPVSFIAVKSLTERIWESGPVEAIRLFLAIVGLISIVSWVV